MPINKKPIKEIMALPYRGLPVGGRREDPPPPSPVAALLLGLTDPEEEGGKLQLLLKFGLLSLTLNWIR